MKKILILILALTMLLVSCGPEATYDTPYDFTHEGLTLTLTTDFKLKNPPDAFTGYYESDKVVVMTLFESFDQLAGAGYNEVDTLEEYTKVVAGEYEVKTDDSSGFLYFTFERSADFKDYYYLATTRQADDGFWLVQYACRAKDKEDFAAMFLEWAGKMKIV